MISRTLFLIATLPIFLVTGCTSIGNVLITPHPDSLRTGKNTITLEDIDEVTCLPPDRAPAFMLPIGAVAINIAISSVVKLLEEEEKQYKASYSATMSGDLKSNKCIHFTRKNDDIDGCDFRIMSRSNGQEPLDQFIHLDEFISQFGKTKECAVLVVQSTSAPGHWTIAGFDDNDQYISTPIDPASELSAKFNLALVSGGGAGGTPPNESELVDLVTSRLGRTQLVNFNIYLDKSGSTLRLNIDKPEFKGFRSKVAAWPLVTAIKGRNPWAGESWSSKIGNTIGFINPLMILHAIYALFDEDVYSVDTKVKVRIDSVATVGAQPRLINVGTIDFDVGKRSVFDLDKVNTGNPVGTGYSALPTDTPLPTNFVVTIVEGNDFGDIVGKGAKQVGKEKDSITDKILEMF